MKASEGARPLGEYEVPSLVAAAHELKSPLALMRQLAFRLGQPGVSESEHAQLVERLLLTTDRSLRLTSDLTRSSRLDDALFELEPLNPEQVCRDIVSELGPLFEAHGRRIGVASRTHPLLLVANRDLLRRILMNFSDNALHYSQPGSTVRLQMTALKHSGMIRIGVRDYGPALSSDMWRTLQKKLARGPQSIHARPQSSGLGLYLASQFADSMNGRIGATRHRDGVTFYVELHASKQLSLL
jgi:signal transduction histidine kinase